GIGAGDVRGRTMRVHVVGAVLRIVFDDEDGSILPVTFARRYSFDQLSNRQIIFGNMRAWRGRTGTRSLRVIAAQADDLELRKLAILLVIAELFQPGVNAHVVGDGQIPRRERR